MTIRFTKMHGIGNDYIYVNGFDASSGHIDDPADVARKISDRHFGVGADGLILVLPPDKGVDAHVRMRMFNADGSESEMCGNGIRCVCKLAHDRGISRANPMKVQTGRGVLTLNYATNGNGKVDCVTVDMGEPILELEKMPVNLKRLRKVTGNIHLKFLQKPDIFNYIYEIPDVLVYPDQNRKQPIQAVLVSMGNPHAVIYSEPVEEEDLKLGPIIENHSAFPQRINVHFVQVHSRHEVTMRTWERGSGATLACGTGASAVCVAGVLINCTDREILAHLPGGDLNLRWDEKTNHVFMTGPATEIFSGEWNEPH